MGLGLQCWILWVCHVSIKTGREKWVFCSHKLHCRKLTKVVSRLWGDQLSCFNLEELSPKSRIFNTKTETVIANGESNDSPNISFPTVFKDISYTVSCLSLTCYDHTSHSNTQKRSYSKAIIPRKCRPSSRAFSGMEQLGKRKADADVLWVRLWVSDTAEERGSMNCNLMPTI